MLLHSVDLEFPVRSDPRYGYGRATHSRLRSLFASHEHRYGKLLADFPRFSEWLARIPGAAHGSEPCWENDFFSGMDAVTLYCTLAIKNPETYLEVGAGYSTKFARRAIRDHGLRTRIVSVDPAPRAEIVDVADEVVTSGIEDVDLSLFDRLGPGDVCFVDNSHRCLMNSDVTVVFLDVLPRLRKDVLVHFHDILLPSDYPAVWAARGYSEQYLLACCLLYGNILSPELPLFYLADHPLMSVLTPIWEGLPTIKRWGCSCWCRVENPMGPERA